MTDKIDKRVVWNVVDSNGKHYRYHFYCPACKTIHGFNFSWSFDQNYFRPTVSPSLLITRGHLDPKYRCHLYIRGGKIEYLRDCSHDLAGKMVDMVTADHWYKKI